jgi:plastocyanin
LQIELPQNITDSKRLDTDEDYTVFADGLQTSSEVASTNYSRTFLIDFEKGVEQIEIQGSLPIPEISPVPAVDGPQKHELQQQQEQEQRQEIPVTTQLTTHYNENNETGQEQINGTDSVSTGELERMPSSSNDYTNGKIDELNLPFVHSVKDESGAYHVKGIVENRGKTTMESTTVRAYFYGANNEIVGFGCCESTDPLDILPGQSATFDNFAYVGEDLSGIPAKYKLSFEWSTQSNMTTEGTGEEQFSVTTIPLQEDNKTISTAGKVNGHVNNIDLLKTLLADAIEDLNGRDDEAALNRLNLLQQQLSLASSGGNSSSIKLSEVLVEDAIEDLENDNDKGALAHLDLVNEQLSTLTNDADRDTTSRTAGGAATLTIPDGASVQGNPAYEPDPITVKSGDTIAVNNKDISPHTVTNGEDATDPNMGKLFDTSIINAGDSAEIVTTGMEPGQYPFFCSVHPYMTGTLTVQ